MRDRVSDALVEKLSEFVSSEIGLFFPRERWGDLERGIGHAAQDWGFEDKTSCIQWLLSTPLSEDHLETLIGRLTIGETYFFRDKKTLQALEDLILPGLIRLRRGKEAMLRIWSAGCCTGEEPYSIAMIVDRMIPCLRDWNIRILGSDINGGFLEKAKRGVYTKWSFRHAPPWVMGEYFTTVGKDRFEISQSIKSMVEFRQLNLMKDSYPSPDSGILEMDVIFCRNVLMYFSTDSGSLVVSHLFESLAEEGWLIVSPSEVAYVAHPDLRSVRFPGAFLFRKKRADDDIEVTSQRPGRRHSFDRDIIFSGSGAFHNNGSKRRLPERAMIADLGGKPTGLAEIPDGRKPQLRDVLSPGDSIVKEDAGENHAAPKEDPCMDVLALYNEGRYEAVVERITEVLSQASGSNSTSNPGFLALLAKAYANQGKLDEARKWCERAIEEDRSYPGHYYLTATVCQEQGRFDESRKFLNQALYLDQGFVLAHFLLGHLARIQGKSKQSRKHLKNALDLLVCMGPGEILPYSDGMIAAKMAEMIQTMIREEHHA